MEEELARILEIRDKVVELKYPDKRRYVECRDDIVRFITTSMDGDKYLLEELINRTHHFIDLTLTFGQVRWNDAINDLIDVISLILTRLPDTGEEYLDLSKNVFIVHGHNNEMKENVARLLETQGLTPIILHEQPDQSLSIIEKIEKYIRDCSFGIILLSPEDEGAALGSKKSDFKKRARQNIILEMGWLLGQLGRKNVVILFKESDDFELPSDVKGVLYKNYNLVNWKYEVIREMKLAGLPVSLDRIKE